MTNLNNRGVDSLKTTLSTVYGSIIATANVAVDVLNIVVGSVTYSIDLVKTIGEGIKDLLPEISEGISSLLAQGLVLVKEVIDFIVDASQGITDTIVTINQELKGWSDFSPEVKSFFNEEEVEVEPVTEGDK